MVIAVDGNTYLGKTTYLLSLMQESPGKYVLVEEYDTDLDLLASLGTHQERQAYYFSLEEERVQRFGSMKSLLVDRSYLSILAHSWVMSHLEKKPHFRDTLAMLHTQKARGKVLIPDQYVFFFQKDEERQYSDYMEKGSEDILYDVQYRRLINRFFEQMAYALREDNMCPPECMLTQLDRLAEEMEYRHD